MLVRPIQCLKLKYILDFNDGTPLNNLLHQIRIFSCKEYTLQKKKEIEETKSSMPCNVYASTQIETKSYVDLLGCMSYVQRDDMRLIVCYRFGRERKKGQREDENGIKSKPKEASCLKMFCSHQ